MANFLEPLLHDLAERFRFLDEELAKTQAPPEAETCRRQIGRLVRQGKFRIESVLSDPDIGKPDFAKNFYHTFKRLSELAQVVEEGPLFALSRFRLEDRFLTRVVGAVCQETGFRDPAPICAAMSSQYYFSMPSMDLILVPHAVRIPGQRDRDSEIIPISIPKFIRSRFRDEADHSFRF
jgi:hypothetical protein